MSTFCSSVSNSHVKIDVKTHVTLWEISLIIWWKNNKKIKTISLFHPFFVHHWNAWILLSPIQNIHECIIQKNLKIRITSGLTFHYSKRNKINASFFLLKMLQRHNETWRKQYFSFGAFNQTTGGRPPSTASQTPPATSARFQLFPHFK